MRMWMLDPKILCRNHLLGEHNEIHKLIGTMRKNISIEGYIKGDLVFVPFLKDRHDEVVKEMKARGYNHHTPLYKKDYINTEAYRQWFKIQKKKLITVGLVKRNLDDLLSRCGRCSDRYLKVDNVLEEKKQEN